MSHLVIPKAKIITPPSVIWTPQPKQELFMQRPEYEVLYGGAAGGGKSDALLIEATRQVHIRTYRAIIFRKTYPQLSELIDRSRDLYSKIFPRARFNEQKHCWVFPSGAKIYFGSMQYVKDRQNYQGKRYAFIGFDELTHFTWDEYSYMFSRNRPGGPGETVYMRATCNPGGVGHGWVKARFIDGKLPMKTYWESFTVEGKTYWRDRTFVPARVFDNQQLLNNDPNYIANLAMLPQAEREALLNGNWDTFQGQVFLEWRNDPEHYKDRQWTHVIEDFKIPKEWKRFRTYDFGYAKPFSVGYWAVDYDGRLYRYHEIYGCTGEPNKGVRKHPKKIGQEIKAYEDKYENGNIIYGIADPSIFDASRGESIAEQMEGVGVLFEPGDNERIAGKMQIHYRLAFDEEGIPMMYVFRSCKDFIRTIPNLVYDDNDVEDINTDGEDHIYDETRYMCMSSPIPPRKNEVPEPKPYNPLDTDYQVPLRQYNFMNI